MINIADTIARITASDTEYGKQARERQLQLTKPTGSLGRLEDIAIQMASITKNARPAIQHKAVVVMAADHGITAEGVSAYPSDVTAQMVQNFLFGGAAINVLARQANADVVIVDIGVAADLEHPDLISRKVRRGTANMAQGPAMSREEALQAITIGIEVLDTLAAKSIDLVATGEMGIGNTTPASAITSVLLNIPVARVTGRGTGLNDQQLTNKVQIIERVITQNQPEAADPIDVLAKVGGLEIAGLVGVILGAAAHRIPVLIDGFISGAAALVAYELCPAIRDYLFAGHVSVESGHRFILEKIGLEPVFDLRLRLGEGTGATLAMHVIDAALRTHNEMATFGEAGVSNKE